MPPMTAPTIARGSSVPANSIVISSTPMNSDQ